MCGSGAVDAFDALGSLSVSLSLPSYFPTTHGDTKLLPTVYKSVSVTSMFRHKTDEESILCFILQSLNSTYQTTVLRTLTSTNSLNFYELYMVGTTITPTHRCKNLATEMVNS